MKTLVIGGTGFIGSNLLEALQEQGHDLVSLSRKSPRRAVPGVRYVFDTLDNIVLVSNLLKDVDTIFHLAWDTTPGSSALQPSLESVNNLFPTLRLLELLQKHTGIHLVFVSSGGAIYDSSVSGSYGETSAIAPKSYYGASKVAIETFLHAYHLQTGNPVTIVRPSNIYGPRQVAKRNFGLIPTIFDCLLNGRALSIWGDGSTTRDFLYIDDFADFCDKVVSNKQIADGNGGINVFNVGSGVGLSINAVCTMIEEISGRTLERDYQAIRDVDLSSVILNVANARSQLDWHAKTPIENGLTNVWQYLSGLTA